MGLIIKITNGRRAYLEVILGLEPMPKDRTGFRTPCPRKLNLEKSQIIWSLEKIRVHPVEDTKLNLEKSQIIWSLEKIRVHPVEDTKLRMRRRRTFRPRAR